MDRSELKALFAEVLAEQKSTSHCQFTPDEVQTIKDFCESFKWVRESSIKAMAGAVVIGIGSAIWYFITHAPKGKIMP